LGVKSSLTLRLIHTDSDFIAGGGQIAMLFVARWQIISLLTQSEMWCMIRMSCCS